MRLALAAAGVGSFMWDLAEDRAAADPQMLILVGQAPGSTFHPISTAGPLVHPDDRQRYVEALARAKDPIIGGALHEDVRVVNATGDLRWVRFSGQTWWDGTPSRPRWMAGVAVDVTRDKGRDETLSQAAAEKDDFISVVAHELRNPLAPLRTSLDLIRLSGDSTSAVERVRSIMERQVSELGALIDDLVDVSRINSGTLRLRRVPTPIAGAIRTAVEANQHAFAAKGIDVSLDPPAAEPLVVDVDPTRLVQALSRLLADAAEFGVPGSTLRVTATRPAEGEAPEMVTITIADARQPRMGRGPQLATPLAQGESGTFPTGLGVGWTVAKKLVELHGGSVQVHSGHEERAGTFVVQLPLLAAGVARDVIEHAGERQSLGRQVLIIDDNEDAAHALAMLVWDLGGEARVAYSGPAGLDILNQFAPDVVLLDIGLAGLDGYETCRQIRSRLGAQVTIIAVTGFGLERDKERAKKAGFDGHLTKPADHRALTQLLADPAHVRQPGETA